MEQAESATGSGIESKEPTVGKKPLGSRTPKTPEITTVAKDATQEIEENPSNPITAPETEDGKKLSTILEAQSKQLKEIDEIVGKIKKLIKRCNLFLLLGTLCVIGGSTILAYDLYKKNAVSQSSKQKETDISLPDNPESAKKVFLQLQISSEARSIVDYTTNTGVRIKLLINKQIQPTFAGDVEVPDKVLEATAIPAGEHAKTDGEKFLFNANLINPKKDLTCSIDGDVFATDTFTPQTLQATCTVAK